MGAACNTLSSGGESKQPLLTERLPVNRSRLKNPKSLLGSITFCQPSITLSFSMRLFQDQNQNPNTSQAGCGQNWGAAGGAEAIKGKRGLTSHSKRSLLRSVWQCWGRRMQLEEAHVAVSHSHPPLILLAVMCRGTSLRGPPPPYTMPSCSAGNAPLGVGRERAGVKAQPSLHHGGGR